MKWTTKLHTPRRRASATLSLIALRRLRNLFRYLPQVARGSATANTTGPNAASGHGAAHNKKEGGASRNLESDMADAATGKTTNMDGSAISKANQARHSRRTNTGYINCFRRTEYPVIFGTCPPNCNTLIDVNHNDKMRQPFI